MKKTGLILFSVMVLAGCSSQTVATSTVQPTSTPISSGDQGGCAFDPSSTADCDTEETSDYEALISTDTFQAMDLKEAVSELQNGYTGVIYFGFSTCPWCMECVPIMKQLADEFGVVIDYVNVRPDGTEKENDIRTEDNPDYVELQTLLDSTLPEEDKKIYVPLLAVIKDGTIVDYRYGTFDEHDAHERTMTEEEVTELTKIYRGFFEDATA